ncbi:phospholipase D family protein [Dokdonella sp.]|uniref:phospholipase D family protein n=1 Tax=Dokdonella sp. TaxID=2291710 RepID=UPI003C6442E4
MQRLFALLLLVLVASCARLPQRADLPEQLALAPAMQGSIAERLVPAEARHKGQSGFRLVSTGSEAYALRAFSSRAAQQSIDIQTYIWHADLTGKLLARHALAAADRGVRVRILVDDLDARAKSNGFAALDAHPEIEVRLYNPFASRSGKMRKAGEMGAGFKRLNHRMHNKSWIVDNRIAMVGGRNLGDEYFGASEATNFVDLDLFMAGPIVPEVSASFDRFWNSPSNYPVAQLDPSGTDVAALKRLRVSLDQSVELLKTSPYKNVLIENPAVQDILRDGTRLNWTADWQFVSDDPLKAQLEPGQRSAVLAVLLPALLAVQSELRLISPYFVPGKQGTLELVKIARRGAQVKILTNSLAANDVAAVHAGYKKYRPDLLKGGVQIWELKPDGKKPGGYSLSGSSGSSLHTKAAIFDSTRIFVGSYNLDPRSTSLNSEQGVLVSDSALASELAGLFAMEIKGDESWQVRQMPDGLEWDDGSRTWDHDPEAPASKRFMAWLIGLLPVEAQL